MKKIGIVYCFVAAFLVAGAALAASPTAAAEGDVRTVEITVTDRGYSPSRIALVADEPARLAFTNEASLECAATVQSDDLGIETTELPQDETTVIEVKPEAPGEYTFACGMDMLQGTLIVETS